MKLYRYSYKGIGIYEAYKMICTFDEWKEFLKSSKVTWLPKPNINSEYKNLESWFTEKGNKIFLNTAYILISQKLRDIKVETIDYSGEQRIIYADEYQVVLKSKH